MSWRPKDWIKNISFEDLSQIEPSLVSMMTEREIKIYEAGADAMLEALRGTGWHVDDDSSFSSLKEHCTLSNSGNTGTYIFIPDEKEV